MSVTTNINPIPQEIQASTFQFPCGDNSLIEGLKTRLVWMSAFAVYMVLVYRSNWQTGLSHALSYTELAALLGMKVSRVKQAMKWLVDNGWVIKNHRGPNKKNTYKLIHHQCEPRQVPDDPDRLPKMCAMPRAEGAPMERMFAGEITWKQMVIWYIKKYISDWTTGEVEATYAKILEYVRFSCSTICEALKKFKKLGLLKRISNAFCSGKYQLFPKPYENRRHRRFPNFKGMRCDGEFWYSYNEKWKISNRDAQIFTKDAHGWRNANKYELEQVNEKIHVDFVMLEELILSKLHQESLR